MQLVDLYFNCHAIFFPLLHRPTFERELSEGMHLRDMEFRNLVLAVAALGSRYSDDPRVLVPGTNCIYSAGWIWFSQIRFDFGVLGFMEPVSLYRLQVLCVRWFSAGSFKTLMVTS